MGTRVENERSDIPNFHLMSYKESGGRGGMGPVTEDSHDESEFQN